MTWLDYKYTWKSLRVLKKGTPISNQLSSILYCIVCIQHNLILSYQLLQKCELLLFKKCQLRATSLFRGTEKASHTNGQPIIEEGSDPSIPASSYYNETPHVRRTSHALQSTPQELELGWTRWGWNCHWTWVDKFLFRPSCWSLWQGLQKATQGETIRRGQGHFLFWVLIKIVMLLTILESTSPCVSNERRGWLCIWNNFWTEPRYCNQRILGLETLRRPNVFCPWRSLLLASVIPYVDIWILSCWDYMLPIWGERCRHLASRISKS